MPREGVAGKGGCLPLAPGAACAGRINRPGGCQREGHRCHEQPALKRASEPHLRYHMGRVGCLKSRPWTCRRSSCRELSTRFDNVRRGAMPGDPLPAKGLILRKIQRGDSNGPPTRLTVRREGFFARFEVSHFSRPRRDHGRALEPAWPRAGLALAALPRLDRRVKPCSRWSCRRPQRGHRRGWGLGISA